MLADRFHEVPNVVLAALPSLSEISFAQLLLGVGVTLVVWLAVATLIIYATRADDPPQPRRHWLSRLIYVSYLVLIAVLAASSFGAILQTGHVSGDALLVHVAAAGGFVFLMVAIAFLYLPSAGDGRSVRARAFSRWWAARWSAWGLVASSLVAAASMLVSMLPVLDTQGLVSIASVHRYAGVAVVATAILHVYCLLCQRWGWR